MKRNKHPKLTALAIVFMVLLAIGGTTVISNIAPTIEPQYETPISDTATNKNDNGIEQDDNGNASATHTATGSYEPTKYDAELYPDMYRIDGKAIIPQNDLQPGDIEYTYDKSTKTQSVHALLSYENYEYGKRDRESISNIDPIGWPDKNGETSVTFSDGTTYNGWFWNRSHLLGHALGGADEEKNLVTGTRAQNVGKNNMNGGMQFAEETARDYLANHKDGTLYYFVTPIYLNGENIPRSVFVDMRSDDGSIDMHIEVFNAMPGYDIDYINGTWSKI
jgi:DNA-entry nuclease